MKAKSDGIFLREIDRELFEYLFAHKVATVRQISRDIYKNSNYKTIMSRLTLLRKLGYIVNQYPSRLKGQLVFSISKRCFENYIAKGVQLRQEMQSYSISHDIGLVDIAYYLKRSEKVVEYYTENLMRLRYELWDEEELRPFLEMRSDAVAKVSYPNGNFFVAIEYEANVKAKGRYRDILSSYINTRGSIPGVFYICSDLKVKKRLLAIEEKLVPKEQSKFYYSTIQALKDSESLVFENPKKGNLILS